jgi:membrane protein implicated in regulation of membrane protease activity
MDHEHQPTPGPAVWIGAGALVAVGGISLLWVPDAPWTNVMGGVLVATGIGSATIGTWRARRRRTPDDRSEEGRR